VTVGNFDGLHLGHQRLLAALKGNNSETAVLTFYPHPQDFFKRSRSSRLFTLRERYLRAAELGVDYFIVLRFNQELARLTAQEFIESILLRGLNISKIVVGSEWRFGQGRLGTVDTLRLAGGSHGFSVETPLVLGTDGVKISSSNMKKVLVDGDLAGYRRLTGRDYECCGRVIEGDKRGRQIGFRTANTKSRSSVITIKNGVYKTTLSIVGEEGEYPAITNVGVRPTVSGGSNQVVVETHILNGFSREIYGARIRVRFLDRIRDEIKFSSLEELKAQIARDIAITRSRGGKSETFSNRYKVTPEA
jgi:riboflavin kinase/FMN adenylyltransferase